MRSRFALLTFTAFAFAAPVAMAQIYTGWSDPVNLTALNSSAGDA